jgi:hypothetical protein
MDLKFRECTENDIWSMMELYQKIGSTFTNDPLFLDYEVLRGALRRPDGRWLIGERNGKISTVISILIDGHQALAKISRVMINPEINALTGEADLRALIRHCIEILEAEKLADFLFCSTMTVPRQFLNVTLEEGFTVLGIFPNALGADNSRLNGLTGYYLGDTLAKKRVSQFALHPQIQPFFEIARAQLDLPHLETADLRGARIDNGTPNIGLEVVNAPHLVARRFEKLKIKHKQLTDFYPFTQPNLLFSDPDEEVQIFARVTASSRFAALVAEDLMCPVNPVQVYQSILELLKGMNVSYFEIINDAADTVGNQWILDASFVPCGYIPAFKRQNDSRRDYVVFCKSFEYVCRPDLNTTRPFLDFFRQFFRAEWKNYVG